MKIKSDKLVELLEERKKVLEQGFPFWDEIENITTEALIEAMPKIATDAEAWKYLKPYIDADKYKETNGKLEEVYRQLKKLDYKMGRLKDKVTTVINAENIKLGEFEQIGSISLVDGGAEVEVIDMIESYKEMLREKSEK